MTETTLNSLLDLRHKFLGFVQRRVHDPATAEDILQTAYLRSLDSASQLRDSDSAVAWFYRILRNAIIDHYRRRAAEGAALERWVNELETEIQPDPILHDATCQCIAGALDTLIPAYASLLREVDLGDAYHYLLRPRAEHHPRQRRRPRPTEPRTALRKQLIRCCGTCTPPTAA